MKSTSTDKLVYFSVETTHEALPKEGKNCKMVGQEYYLRTWLAFQFLFYNYLEIILHPEIAFQGNLDDFDEFVIFYRNKKLLY